MATQTATSGMTPQQMAILCQKLYDADSDIRYMSLNDLLSVTQSQSAGSFLTADLAQCTKMVDGFLNTLNDPNGEVQNLTIKCLGPFVLRAHPDILSGLLTRVANQKFDNTVDSSISSMALRTIITSLPRPGPSTRRDKAVNDAYTAISSVLIPRLLGTAPVQRRGDPPSAAPGLLTEDLRTGVDSQAIDILTDIARCFGSMLQPAEVEALQQITLQLLESPKSGAVMKKKALVASAALAPLFSDRLLSAITTHIMDAMKKPHLTSIARKNYISFLGSLARAIPAKFGPHLKVIVPFVLAPLSQTELDEQMSAEDAEEHDVQTDEVRETALITLEIFLLSCPGDMQRFTAETLDAILRFLKYDPNFMGGDEEMDDDFGADDDFADDEDFEQDDAGDDDDDISWKARRSAAKTLQAIISVKGKELLEPSDSFMRISKALLDRFKEREESVRLEVVRTATFMVRQCAHDDGDGDGSFAVSELEATSLVAQMATKKRRRGLSDLSVADHATKRRLTGSDSPSTGSPAPPGSAANLAEIGPSIVSSSLALAKSSTTPTKLACVTLLKSYIVARHGGAKDALKEIFDLSAEHVNSSQGSAIQILAGSGPGSLQVESLRLLSEVCKATSSADLQAHIAKVVPAVAQATRNKSTQIACEALRTSEQIVKALTPPRSASKSKEAPKLVASMLEAMVEIAAARSSDLDTRKQAIAAIGTTTGRTLSKEGSGLVTSQQRARSFELLQEGLKNETTRVASIKAVEVMSLQAPSGMTYDKTWFTIICIELGNQLRKADRVLRSASLSALRTLISERKGSKNIDDVPQLSTLLLPLLSSEDLHLIGPALVIYASLIMDGSSTVVTDEFMASLCKLLSSSVSTNVLDQLSALVEAAGARGFGKQLMPALLQVGTQGPPVVVGKVIGDLMVTAGSENTSLTLDALLQELKTQPDEKRKCLSLSIIGEYGLRSGSASSLKPELFTAYFKAKSHDVALAAAIALGRVGAGSGNLKAYVPVILESTHHYLALSALREILQYTENQQDLAAFSKSMWENAAAASLAEENRFVGAECLSQLTLLSPKASLQTLQAMLQDKSAATRSTAIVTFRDLFSTTDARYNKYLRPIIVDIVSSMMRDSLPENRKTALNALGAAARHKPELILPALGSLIKPILDQTVEDPSLIHEVSMGPFKHKVDDGLEARKSAYETLYSLLELSSAHFLPLVPTVLPRIVAGISDDSGIRTLCQHMIITLAQQVPYDIAQSLDEVAAKFKAILTRQVKENSVRVEQERLDEAKKSVIKASVHISQALAEAVDVSAGARVKIGEGGVAVQWKNYMDDLPKDWSSIIREFE